ncbi:DeoR/GlpR family DNA-binding transcription regulator [Pleomorphomonas carboxyditropha]|uniref:DeoR/GlpR family DNA-binding transcription regulator n=1 Tax=Pleomorphomonas carboxyditropha TaxID=2023338 RepID=UPI001A9C41B2|nr:DeoR/GlpR family DNA-binding transcription regulator [Pleomorphomonas carboxyditropha]
MKKAERLGRLEDRLREAGVLHLSDAAGHLGVSEMTVRRDLASAPHLFNYLGGYILPAGGERTTTYRLDAEADTHAEAKELACRKAARLVEPDDTIFIDCGTTTPRMTEYLPVTGKLTVITYAMNVAERVMKRPNTNLILLGGLFHASSQTFSGDEALRTVERLGISKAFLSAGGLHSQHGATCSNFHEVPIKQAVLARAGLSYVVIDSSKLEKIKPAFFATTDQFDEIITE